MAPVSDILICLRFFSRLPVPATRREAELGPSGLARAAAMVPVAGAIIGVIPAFVLVVAVAIGIPSSIAADIAVATLVITTGALHEDALADCTDGFGGRDRARKLEIMRDSRIGSFGASAIALSLLLRAAALGAIAARSLWLAATILVVTASLSRSACLLPLLLLPPARADGLGQGAGRPAKAGVVVAVAIATALTLTISVFGPSLPRVGAAIVFAWAAALATCGIAWHQIRGQTGDVAGAAQQMAEITMLLVFASVSGPV